MGVEEGYSLAILNLMTQIDNIWKELIKYDINSQKINDKLVVITKKLEEMRKTFYSRKKEIRSVLTKQGFPCPPKQYSSSLDEVEKEIFKVILDKIRKSYPTNKMKVFQRELIKLNWSEETLEELLNSEISLITSNKENSLKIKSGERIHHNLASSILENIKLQQNILTFTGLRLMPTKSKLVQPFARFILSESRTFLEKGEYLFSMILLRLALELCLYEGFELFKFVNKFKLAWKGTPYFKEILDGIETINISLPINKTNLSHIYYFLSKSIHTGSREEFSILWKLHTFITKFIETMLSTTFQNEKKQALVKWLNENSKMIR